jgi:cytochrome c biogenesis protein CcmG/thiol:disulfide interchange protein DsbE
VQSIRTLAAVTLAAALMSCGGGEGTASATVDIGAPAPTYAAEKLDGSPIALADLRGQVVLLNIWATWCKPCREEIPALERLHQAHAARGLLIAGVSIDVVDDTARIAGFARDLGATYPLWLDRDDRVSMIFRSIGVPSTYLIDRAGVLRWRHMGPVRSDDPALLAALETALADTTAR